MQFLPSFIRISFYLLLCINGFSQIFVIANTESILISIPKDFPATRKKNEDSTINPLPHILLNDTAPAYTNKLTLDIPVQNHKTKRKYYIELLNLQNNSNYQIKLCWSAIHPLIIDNLDWHIIPPYTVHLDSPSGNEDPLYHFDPVDYPRIIVSVNIDTHLFLKNLHGRSAAIGKEKLPQINISVIKTFLGIPMDLYPIVTYITMVVIAMSSIYYCYTRSETKLSIVS
ncbi:Pga1p NDAI_0F03120 [Naumovozyma dairenensis CBS 421]|uniref:Uncharacterized protein n=1 Tax=Naumovozyma dairenensis (strain ATCC 10597 / BCRC 20456 / CBS 421 / NBRC 0211 / NRRL Y-12639) TaxID=1071378 RepID=G0WCW9_NAUDC|nr:hypothetical protein NDAI_0F03120 [Naumovozyma dairenensis CBS 421]CCD25630.1 hypothetical protein NDAI_0F03120 [Naumovozyma dairenensis CBS 421]